MTAPSKATVQRIQNLLLVVLLFIATMYSRAQTVTGSVRGTITDPTGANIPGATVIAINTATGVSTSNLTNSEGLYSIRFLQVGSYTLRVVAEGFEVEHSSPFQLEIDQEATINVPMHLRGTKESVTVTFDATPILNTENPTLGVTVDQKTIESMPMNSRNFTSATVAIPGSIHTSGQPNDGPAINGNRPETNSFLLDGLDIFNQMNGQGLNNGGNGPEYNPNPDALQEMRVITSNANAEFGNANGGLIVAVTKSGTNHIHGSAFIQLQNHNMAANPWKGGQNSPFTTTNFGGTVGGPIIKNKLFFFGDYQGYRTHASGTNTASVIPDAMRNGDFSAIPTQLYDKNGTPFAGNQLPILNPVAQYLFAHPEVYPHSNQLPNAGVLANNYSGPYNTSIRTNQGDVKIDWKASSHDDVSGRFTLSRYATANPSILPTAQFPFSTTNIPYTSFVVNAVHVFSNNAVNEARIGFGRQGDNAGLPTDPSGDLGTSGNQKVGLTLPQALYVGFTQQSFTGGTNNTNASNVGVGGTQQAFALNTFLYGDTFSFQHGRHLFKFGAQFLRYQSNYFYGGNAGALGTMNYSGAFSSPGAVNNSNIADFVLGYVASVQTDSNAAAVQLPGFFGQRQWRDGYFAQDDWKVLPNLTLNLGVRYDYFQPIYEVNNRMTNLNPVTAALEFAGQNGNSRALYNPRYNNFQPRIGFAYSPNSRTVLRGGYGMSSYFEGMGVGGRLTQNSPWQNAYLINAVNPTGTPGSGAPLPVTTGVPTSSINTKGNSYKMWDSNIQPSRSQMFSLTAEYQISNNSSLQVGYVGQTEQHLAVPVQANQWPASCAGASTCPSVFYAAALGDSASIQETSTTGMMNYNSLQVVFRKHTNALNFTANYTYSKSMTNGGQGWNGLDGTNGNYYQQDAFNLAAEYGPSPLDATHNASAVLVYELPFGRGRRFGSEVNRAEELVLGGWKVSSLASVFTGNPLTINSPNNYGGQIHNSANRANHLRPLHVVNRSNAHWFGTDPSALPCRSTAGGGYQTPVSGLIGDPSTCAYSTQSFTSFGTASNGSERGPGFHNIDISAFKAFNITDHQNVEFRADAFNAFNFANYDNPDTNAGDDTFGVINNVRNQGNSGGEQRIIQLGLSYHF